VEEAVYLGDRVFLMASNPGRLVEILKVPRPAEPPEESRRKPWFINFCQALLRRLEEESAAPPVVKV
jgi:ABC-type nitrate/sulfonate/bicarbonate transport system ATPase subunit